MARKAYNYTIANDYKQKIIIPYINLEFIGWLPFISALVGGLTSTICIGFVLSFILGDTAYLISAVFSIIFIGIVISFTMEVNQEIGKNKLTAFYYENIKRYHYIYDSKGEKHYIAARKKGVIYTNACR